MKLSIIIPIYNVEKFLNKCLISVLKQIEKEDELILINDGSTDNSFNICKNIKEKYKKNNILLINKKNEGVSVARNIGLKIATGDYIFWIDSDDWLNDNCIKLIKNTIEKTKSDIILFDFYNVSKKNIKLTFIFEKSKMLTKKDILIDIAQDRFRSFLWRTVVKRKIYEDIYFPEGVQMMEDFSIYHILFHKANTFFYIKKPLYYYRLVNNSLSQKKKNIELIYNISLQREEFFRKNYPEIDEKYRLVPVLSASCAILETYKIKNEKYGDPKKLIRKYLIFLLTRSYIGINKKIQFMLVLISKNILKLVRIFYNKKFTI
ncbi:glycosyltransferase family 2 protein [Megamonas funiformis]|uniref:glycosyltransferase family 2 protein n=1 Tax=Megamonas funiformis TaxID=437897 RepID=UPI00265D3B90|nr:glycosyltransferase family 2 protein [Megamonas funiformis]